MRGLQRHQILYIEKDDSLKCKHKIIFARHRLNIIIIYYGYTYRYQLNGTIESILMISIPIYIIRVYHHLRYYRVVGPRSQGLLVLHKGKYKQVKKSRCMAIDRRRRYWLLIFLMLKETPLRRKPAILLLSTQTVNKKR